MLAFVDVRRDLRVLPHAIGYELRKASAFRMGFLLRELLGGLGRPLVMMFVYFAMFESAGLHELRGYTLRDLIAYLVWTAVIQKIITDERSFDIADQIFDGYITKYLVMPVRFFTLVLAKVVQLTLVQTFGALLFWTAGALIIPSYWAFPASGTALLQATLLVLMGAYCYAVIHYILNCLAFWLDVVWSPLALFRFISQFISGILIPISLMPQAANDAFQFMFPYWTAFAPAEILLGRAGTPFFLKGVLVLALSILGLQLLAAFVWRRGTARFAGAGA